MLNIFSKLLIEKVRKDYNSIADSFSETREKPWEDWNLLKKYFEKDKTVLDIGCGNGRLADFLSYKSFLGIDISKRMIEIASEKHKNVDFKVGSFTTLPSQKFDRIISIAAFHHLPSPSSRKKALHKVRRALKKDGIFMFSVWNLLCQPKYTKACRWALLRSILTLGVFHPRDLLIPWKKGLNKRKRYYYAFKVAEVIDLLEKSGFEMIEVLMAKHGKKVEIKDALNVYFVCEKKKSKK